MINKRKFRLGSLICIFMQIFTIIFAFVLVTSLNGCRSTSVRKEYIGYFRANDSGESHGGFEWGGEYEATLVIAGNKGDLILTFSIGLGDFLTRHQFSVSDFSEVAGNLSFKIEGRAALLVLVEQDSIWNGEYDGYFAANKSSNDSERIGNLPIEPFSGFKSHFYIDLRLKSSQPESRFLIFN